MNVQSDRGLSLDLLDDGATEVTRGVGSLRKTEHGDLVIRSHSGLGSDQSLENTSEGFLEGVGLLFKQVETLLGSNSLVLVDLEGPIENSLV